jgi:hypothetical protein
LQATRLAIGAETGPLGRPHVNEVGGDRNMVRPR